MPGSRRYGACHPLGYKKMVTIEGLMTLIKDDVSSESSGLSIYKLWCQVPTTPKG